MRTLITTKCPNGRKINARMAGTKTCVANGHFAIGTRSAHPASTNPGILTPWTRPHILVATHYKPDTFRTMTVAKPKCPPHGVVLIIAWCACVKTNVIVAQTETMQNSQGEVPQEQFCGETQGLRYCVEELPVRGHDQGKHNDHRYRVL